MWRKQLGNYLVYVVARVLVCVMQTVPIKTAHDWARKLAWLFADVLRVRGKLVDENLRHAFSELPAHERKKLARRMWEHLFLLILEVANAPRKIHETNWRRSVRLDHAERLVRHLLSERPTVIVTGHFGNFEIGGYVLGMLGFPSYTVARTLDNPYLHQYLDQFRRMTGQHIIPKKGGYSQILEVLASGGTMAFLADQAAGPKDCWVEFFGRPASTHKAIALLSLEHDAPLVVCYTRRVGGPLSFEVVTTGAADPRTFDEGIGGVRGLTEWYTRQLEEGIRQSPDQYWWVHRRWKERPKRPRRKKQAA